MKVYHELKPIYNKNSKILILGSMPSKISRDNNFYYANKTNRFWPVMSILFNKNLNTNLEKKQFLIENNIALWDVIASCDINGSSDSSIKNIKVNNINKILKETEIKYIFCTGLKAYTIFKKHFKIDIPVIYLPSPSSANASLNINDLIKIYNVIKTSL